VARVTDEILGLSDHGRQVERETILAGNAWLHGKICRILNDTAYELIDRFPDLQPHIKRFVDLDAPVIHGVSPEREFWDDALGVHDQLIGPSEPLSAQSADMINRRLYKYVYFRLVNKAVPRYIAESRSDKLLNG